MYSNKLTLTIAGDVGLNVGDVIFCDFPEITSDKGNIDQALQEVDSIYDNRLMSSINN